MADKITDGLKHDGGKPRLDLVPPEIIEAVGTVMTHGAEKYGEASYKDVEPKRYRAALMRHICKWLKEPHGIDEDSKLPHLWHIACNVAFLLELDNPKQKKTCKPTIYSLSGSDGCGVVGCSVCGGETNWFGNLPNYCECCESEFDWSEKE